MLYFRDKIHTHSLTHTHTHTHTHTPAPLPVPRHGGGLHPRQALGGGRPTTSSARLSQGPHLQGKQHRGSLPPRSLSPTLLHECGVAITNIRPILPLLKYVMDLSTPPDFSCFSVSPFLRCGCNIIAGSHRQEQEVEVEPSVFVKSLPIHRNSPLFAMWPANGYTIEVAHAKVVPRSLCYSLDFCFLFVGGARESLITGLVIA